MRDSKVLTPLFYVSKPIGRSIRVQPAIRCDPINDDGGVPKNAEEKLDILGVETVDVIFDKGLDFSRRGWPCFLRASRARQPRHSSNERDEFASPHRLPPRDDWPFEVITFPPSVRGQKLVRSCRIRVLVVWKRPARLAYRADAGEGLAMP